MSYFIDHIFPTPVYSSRVDNFDKIQEEMHFAISSVKFDMIEEWGQTHYVSTPTFNDRYDMPLFEMELQRHLEVYCDAVNFPMRNYTLRSWFTKFERGNYGHIHNHGHHDISVCYYVKTKGSSGSIFFETPAESATTSIVFKEYTNRFWHPPEEGKLLLFPSYLRHGITTNTTDIDRISFSANIQFNR